ncbi:MAG: molybdenum cofactor guanylyltransferase [Chloroflexi bacterium HGW-Chloroflexi-10]|nr:MAG: molybdenum cofactor guanylyltransferase [Chloroflexi bacterium HGW-Chloroflexi-10]
MYSIVIQAGGKSSRMGQDKSFLMICGKPMIQHIIERVSGLGDDLIVTTNEPDKFIGFKARFVQDEFAGVGALAGLHAGIKAARNDLVIAVANDMPFINYALFEYMQQLVQADLDVVIPHNDTGYEPFYAVYRRSTCLPAIEKAIQDQKRRIISWFDTVTIRTVENDELKKFDPHGLTFFNVNTPEDALFAEQNCV